MTTLFSRLLLEDSGQDVVEYALIALFVGIAGAAVVRFIPSDIFNTYSSWTDPNSGVPSLWDTPAPGAS